MKLPRLDPRFVVRRLVRRPGFAALVILTTALGVGASTTMFSVLHGVVLKPLPYPEPDRLARLDATLPDRSRVPWTGADFVDFVAGSASWEAAAGYVRVEYSFLDDGLPRVVSGASVTNGFFSVFGVDPILGRAFNPDADPPGGPRVAVLSHSLWKSRFGADPDVVGRDIDLNGQPATVVGVMPPGFGYPRGARVWVPSRSRAPEDSELRSDPASDRGSRYFRVVGRLRPGATFAEARQEGAAIFAELEEAHPETNRDLGFNPVPLHEVEVGDLRPMLTALFGAAALVLLVACANVANLLLAAATGRVQEFAVRSALGAGRGRLAWQLLGESLVLGLAGGLVGALLATYGTRALLSFASSSLPRASEVSVSLPVLGYALAVSLVSGLVFGVAPVLWLSRRNPAEGLREGVSRSVVGGRTGTARAALVVSEMAVALALLVGAGLLMRTLAMLTDVDPGFSGRNVLAADVWVPGAGTMASDELRAFHREVLEKVRALPGVGSAGAVLTLPVGGGVSAVGGFVFEGRPVEPGREVLAGLQSASPGYLETLGIPVLQGRAFADEDGPDAAPVMVVSQAFAERYFPGEDPIGRRVSEQDPAEDDFQWSTIVGVVGDARYDGLDGEPRPEAYRPLAQRPWPWITLVLRTESSPAALAEPLRRTIAEISPTQPVERITTMDEIRHQSLESRRLHMRLLGLFAAVALVLAAVGLHGVMSFAVAQRSREIGIRISVGARPADIRRLVLGQASRMVGLGLLIGAVGAVAAGRLMEGFLYGVPPTDPAAYALGAATLAAAALVAAWRPSYRAVHTDPVLSLRRE